MKTETNSKTVTGSSALHLRNMQAKVAARAAKRAAKAAQQAWIASRNAK